MLWAARMLARTFGTLWELLSRLRRRPAATDPAEELRNRLAEARASDPEPAPAADEPALVDPPPEPAQEPDQTQSAATDPAEELRNRLAEARASDPEPAPAADEPAPVDPPPEPAQEPDQTQREPASADLENLRRDVHERARSLSEEMRGASEKD